MEIGEQAAESDRESSIMQRKLQRAIKKMMRRKATGKDELLKKKGKMLSMYL